MAKVYGYSDDIVVIEHLDGGCTEIDCYDKDVAIEFGDGTVIHRPGSELRYPAQEYRRPQEEQHDSAAEQAG